MDAPATSPALPVWLAGDTLLVSVQRYVFVNVPAAVLLTTRLALVKYPKSIVRSVASFASVTKAMDCAIALQRAFAAREGEPLRVRVGLNAGEPIEEDGDLFGSTVIMASRIAGQAGPGEILIPELLRHLVSGKSYVYADRGETTLKGFEDAVRLYEVRWRS